MTTPKGQMPMPLIYVPAQGAPKQLFVLLHDDASSPVQLSQLAQSVKQAFPQSMVVLPYAPLRSADTAHHWFEQNGLTEENYVERVKTALPALINLIQRLQRQYQLEGEHTALAGFGQGATIALEAVHAQFDLAGRVLAFSGCYARLPDMAPPATTLHLLHGEEDPLVPVEFMRETHEHLAELQGDATLDIATKVGHELHDALIRQAIYRLQTCVPLRSWKAALGELRSDPDVPDLNDLDPPSRTLH
ncbi:esterase [Pusillimonas caeni]|uniref:esterase n=1 Tax=Pusillimonas caeni TaxID=1348472 RepID=UPI000E599567|nr:esterase [Pusillimonas caeni]TFL10046.1 esterase [Pusillimonas caeni]